MQERIERDEDAWHRGCSRNGKAAPLPDTVRGRAEHGGQEIGETLCVFGGIKDCCSELFEPIAWPRCAVVPVQVRL